MGLKNFRKENSFTAENIDFSFVTQELFVKRFLKVNSSSVLMLSFSICIVLYVYKQKQGTACT